MSENPTSSFLSLPSGQMPNKQISFMRFISTVILRGEVHFYVSFQITLTAYIWLGYQAVRLNLKPAHMQLEMSKVNQKNKTAISSSLASFLWFLEIQPHLLLC